MTATSLRLLIVEDAEDDALLLVRELRKGGYAPDFVRVETPQELKAALDGGFWDAVFSDYNLPAFTGLDALRMVRESGLDLPFILVSGVMGEETAVEALQAGAHDYLMKGRYARLVPALERALKDAALRHERRQTAEELSRHREHLEELVQQRTEELDAANEELRSQNEELQAQREELNRYLDEIERVNGELRDSREQLRLMVDGIRDYAIFMLDPQGRVLTWNEGAERIKGYGAEEIVGRHFSCFYCREDRANGKPVHGLRTAEAEGRYEEEGWRVRKDGSQFWASVMITPLRDDDGNLRGFSKVTRDITERKRGEEERERLNTDLAARAVELEAANVELEAFNYTVSHDLRGPLTVIGGYTDVLRQLCGDRLDEESMGYLAEIANGTLRMSRLIDTLLRFSRLAHVDIKKEAIDLSGLAMTVISDLRMREPLRAATVTIAQGLTANGDRQLLRLVLENLLGNAWKYTGARDEARIEFGKTDRNGQPAFFVRDYGEGFDMACAEKLFIPFQRLPGAEEFKGHGIGLATVHRIVQRHSGRVWAEGEPGAGATFYFTLPPVV
ncbi:MAG TPA: PAS domain S-box protein [Geobacteraceae bacterium]